MRYSLLAIPLSLFAFAVVGGCDEPDIGAVLDAGPDGSPRTTEPGVDGSANDDAGGLVDASLEGGADASLDASSDAIVDAGADGAILDAAIFEAGPDAAIGAFGGTAKSADGLASIDIPPGVVSTDTNFVVNPSPLPLVGTFASKAYDFLPGTKFNGEATICLTVDSKESTQSACLAFYNEKTTTWECQDPCLTPNKDQLCGKTDHLTSFAILLGTRSDSETCSSGSIPFVGGVLSSKDAKAEITIPSGALTEPKRITIIGHDDLKGDLQSIAFDFLPNGLAFTKDATICIEPSPKFAAKGACLGYLDENVKPPTWTCEDTCLSPGKNNQVCGETDHFTNFAILLSGGSSDHKACVDSRIPITGGTLASLDGNAKITIPSGALTKPTRISITKTDDAAAFKGLISESYEFLPNGQKFAAEAEVCIKPNDAAITTEACLGYLNDAGGWTCEASCLEVNDNKQLCGKTNHFTKFVMVQKGGSGLCIKK